MFQHLQKLKQGQPVGWVERYWNQTLGYPNTSNLTNQHIHSQVQKPVVGTSADLKKR